MAKEKKSKNQLRREKQKLLRQNVEEVKKVEEKLVEIDQNKKSSSLLTSIDIADPSFQQFQKIFERFQTVELDEEPEVKESTELTKGEIIEDHDEANETKTISKKQQRIESKIPLSVLKATSKYPELVEWFDVDSKDPYFLINIKSTKNAVPVPNHWQLKREYLSARREKKPFTLPSAIAATGITEMRDTTVEEEKSLKEQQRAKVRPKLNRLDLDYQRLYDAFFKHQVKPKLYAFGDVYYESKEIEEIDKSSFRPGFLSDELKNALGITDGMSVPWAIKMKQFGAPPSYPDLKVPGFNAPLEEAGQIVEIGKDEELGIKRELFGQLLSYEEEEEEEQQEGEEGQAEEEEDDEENIEKVIDEDAAVVVPEEELRIQEEVPVYELSDEEDVQLPEDLPIRTTTEQPIEPKKLYQILKEKFTDGEKDGLLSNSRSYEINTKRSGDEEPEIEAKKPKTLNKNEDEDAEEEDEEEEDDEKFKF